MVTAIPMSDDHIAGHFTKADYFLFINPQGQVVGHYLNPAKQEGCGGKRNLINILKANRTERVIVRNIGQQMLGRLLKQNFAVFKVESGRQTVKELLTAELPQLTEASQGRPSTRHQQKGGCCSTDGGCCSH